jgi:hypothetical protein
MDLHPWSWPPIIQLLVFIPAFFAVNFLFLRKLPHVPIMWFLFASFNAFWACFIAMISLALASSDIIRFGWLADYSFPIGLISFIVIAGFSIGVWGDKGAHPTQEQ